MKPKQILDKIIMEQVKKALNENTPFQLDRSKPYSQNVISWFESKGLKVKNSPGNFQVFKDGKLIFERTSNSFFRSSHLDSFVNQVAKQLGIPNDFK